MWRFRRYPITSLPNGHPVTPQTYYSASTAVLKVRKAHGDTFVHHASMVCESGAEFNFLQEYYLVALDVFQKSEYSKTRNPEDRLTGWLLFFCTQNIDDAEALCQTYPWLSDFYVEMAQFGRKPEEMIGMFSEILREMDRNTIRYMVDDMQAQIENQKLVLAENEKALADSEKALAENEKALAENKKALAEKDAALLEKDKEIKRLKELLATTQNK